MKKVAKIYSTLDYLRRKGKWHMRKSVIAAINTKDFWTDTKTRKKQSYTS